jgi:hypothetical protein
MRVERLEDRLAPAIIQDGVPSWLAAGPAPVTETVTQLAGPTADSPITQRTGAVQAVSPHPTDPTILFAAGVNGGVWRTTNATTPNPTWTPLTDQLPALSVSDMALNPDFPNSLAFGLGGTSSAFELSGDLVGGFVTDNALDPVPAFRRLTGGFVSDLPDPFGQYPDVNAVVNRTVWQPVYGADGRTVFRDPAGRPVFDQIDVLLVGGENGVYRAIRLRGRVVVDPANVRFTAATATAPEQAVVLPPPGQTALGTRVAAGAFPLPPGVSAETEFRPFVPLSGVGGLPAAITDPAISVFSRPKVFQIVADPADARVVYVVGTFGVYRTSDITAAAPQWVDITPGRTAGGGSTLPPLTTIGPNTTRVKLSVHASTSRTPPAAGDVTNNDNIVYLAINNPDPTTSSARATVFWSNDARQATAGGVGGAVSTATWVEMDEALNLTGVRAITDIPVALGNPITVQVPAHGLVTGDRVLISGVEGVREANAVWTVDVNAPDTFVLRGSIYSTGPWVPGSGSVRRIYGVSPGSQGNIHFALEADPTSPFLVYIGGDSQRVFGVDGPQGILANSPIGNVFRGDRRKPRQFGRVTLDDFVNDRLQNTPLMFNYTANGRANYADTRDLQFDAQGSLILADDGGVYKRTEPFRNGGVVTAVIGNLDLGQFYRIQQDTLNGAQFGGTQDTGSIQQDSGLGPVGSPGWNVFPGTAGDGFWAVADNTRATGNVTVRYVTGNNGASSLRRQVYDASGNQIEPISPVRFESPTDAGYLAGLDAADKAVFGLNPFAINRVDGRLMLWGRNNVYEDNDPQGRAGDVVAKVNPPGFSGILTAVEYGGYQVNGFDPTTGRPTLVAVPRVAYVGTSNGDVFVRGPVGTLDSYSKANLPPLRLRDPNDQSTWRLADYDPSIKDIVVDPDDYRTFYVLRGNRVFRTIDFGATFVDLTANLVATGVDALGNPVGGLTNQLWSLALHDSDPGYPNFEPSPLLFGKDTGRYTLLAGGNNGVFRLAPTAVDPSVSVTAPWTEYGTGLPNTVVFDLTVEGNTLIAGTQGRGAWAIPDVSGTIQKRAAVTVIADTPTSVLSITPDASNPTVATVSDGVSKQQFTVGAVDFNFVGNGTSTLTVGIDGANGPNRVTVTGSSIEFAPAAGATSKAGRVTYSGFEGGTLAITLGDALPTTGTGTTVNIEGTSARLTRVSTSLTVPRPDGTRPQIVDTVNIGFLTGAPDNLSRLGGDVEVIDRDGGDLVRVSDLTATAGNQNVVLTAAGGTQAINNIGGPLDTAAIRVTGVGAVAVLGSDTVGDVINVRGTAVPVSLLTGGGNDLVRVSSFAGDSDDGDLSGVNAPVTVDAGTGDNRLIISQYGSPAGANLTVGPTAVTGGPAAISYAATGGRFFNGPSANGLWVRGSNAGADRITVAGTLAGSQTLIDGNGGDDVFTLTGDGLGGAVWVRGGAGADTTRLNPGQLGNTADSLRLSGGGDAGDVATVVGLVTGDNATVAVFGPGAARVTGVRNPVDIDATARVVFDGAGSTAVSKNNLTVTDATGQTFGTPTTPLAGIVYQPTGPTSGEVRFGPNGAGGPVVGFANVNGSDLGGLVINGTNTGPGADVLTVLGSTLADSKDTFIVDDRTAVVLSSRQGPLRAVALGGILGQPTFDTFYIRAGANNGAGNRYQVTPSRAVNILVDGVQAQGGANAGRIEVLGGEPFTIGRSTDPLNGPPQSRVTTASGASFGFLNVSTVTGPDGVGAGGPQVYAVGSDFGGGPRVRVYNSASGALLTDRFVYSPTFTGGVRVATGDVTGDGVPDLITGAGLLGGPHVQVFDGVTFAPIASFFAYEDSFRGGVYVTTGDVDGDGKAEIITGTGVGGGPLVRVFDGTGKLLTQLFPFESTFRGGVNVATGDVNGDGRVDIVTTAGPGGGAVVRAFDPLTLTPVTEYIAFDPEYRGGLFVSAGDLDGDGVAEIAVAPAVDGSTEVRVRRGSDGSFVRLAALTGRPTDLSAGPPANRPASLALGGVRVKITENTTSDGRGELLAVPGPGKPGTVFRYGIDPVSLVGTADAFEPGFTGGVFIG